MNKHLNILIKLLVYNSSMISAEHIKQRTGYGDRLIYNYIINYLKNE